MTFKDTTGQDANIPISACVGMLIKLGALLIVLGETVILKDEKGIAYSLPKTIIQGVKDYCGPTVDFYDVDNNVVSLPVPLIDGKDFGSTKFTAI